MSGNLGRISDRNEIWMYKDPKSRYSKRFWENNKTLSTSLNLSQSHCPSNTYECHHYVSLCMHTLGFPLSGDLQNIFLNARIILFSQIHHIELWIPLRFSSFWWKWDIMTSLWIHAILPMSSFISTCHRNTLSLWRALIACLPMTVKERWDTHSMDKRSGDRRK